MPAFLLIAMILLAAAALLYFAPQRKLLNIVDYDAVPSPARVNRYAAVRLLIPAAASAACAGMAALRPDLTVVLIFPAMVAILVAVVWIAAGVYRLKA